MNEIHQKKKETNLTTKERINKLKEGKKKEKAREKKV